MFPNYVELHAHSYYSLLDGASSPDDLVRRAAELNMQALALTDHDAIYGVIPFIHATKKHGMKPLLGAEITLERGYHLTLLVKNQVGWENLCYLISCARHNAPKGEALLPSSELEHHTEGLIGLSGCKKGEIRQALRRKEYQKALAVATRYRNWFSAGDFWIELQNHLLPEDNTALDQLVALAKQLQVGYVATNNVHYATQEKHKLQDVLVCIQHNKNLDSSRHLRRPNSEYYLKSSAHMEQVFRKYPLALQNTLQVAEKCQFELTYGLQDLPQFQVADGLTSEQYLARICSQALEHKGLLATGKEKKLLRHELGVIERAGLANYFLIVGDIVRYARDSGILCQGRGSAANSLVAYLLNISPINPIEHDLVFERFLSDERVSVPDIDIDFAAGDEREKVIQYVYERYGKAHTAMASTFVTFGGRSAIRDIGKALSLPAAMLEEAALAFDRGDSVPLVSEYARQLVDLCEQIQEFPRHVGLHNGGMVISRTPLSTRLPTEPARMPNRTVVQFDKEMLETAGIVKIDLLGLRMLSAIADAVTLVEKGTGERPRLSELTFDDPALFKMMTKSDTVGVFQVESRAQAQTLPRLKPKTFNDLIVSISLIRPGPIQGNMVHPYLNRRVGKEHVSYPHHLLEDALEETLGVILFQEQVLKVARDLAGFTAGQGEELRRALGGKRPEREIERLHDAFIEGTKRNDVLEEIAENVFESLKAFGGYSFPKSHAAAFAVLVYQSAWLKYYHPAAFYVALLCNQPMGFWTPAVVINDARRHGIEIRRVDINRSYGKCTLEENAIRIGFSYISGIGNSHATKIEAGRENGMFSNLSDFVRRTKLPLRIIENLILVGAMDEWGIDRRKLLWELGNIGKHANSLGLVFPDDGVELQPLSKVELMILETQVMGLSTGEHVMTFYHDWMAKRGVLGSKALQNAKHRQKVQVAGEVVMHQAPPTAKGFYFITLEDKDDMMNIIVRPPIYRRYKHVLRHSPLLLISGEIQREGDIVNVLCEQATVLPRLREGQKSQ